MEDVALCLLAAKVNILNESLTFEHALNVKCFIVCSGK